MMLGLYTGLEVGRGTRTGIAGGLVDGVLVLHFVLIHSFVLSPRGRALLARFVPLGIGRELSTTSFAAIASLQLLLSFGAWSPIGPVWWEPHGALRVAMSVAYAVSWGLLLEAMADAGLALQTGLLGWGAVLRDRAPRYDDFPARGLFRYVRQSIYVVFALTLWTGPVLKKRRYRAAYGDRFERYRQLVPYWFPALRKLDPRLLE